MNSKKVLAALILMAGSTMAWANGTKTVFHLDIQRTTAQTTESSCAVNPNVLANKLHCKVKLEDALTKKTVKWHYVNPSNGRYSNSSSVSPYGNYFNANGMAVSGANKAKILQSKFTLTAFCINTEDGMVEEGKTYSWKQALINTETNDTVDFHFTMTIGAEQSMTSDIPTVNHRKDRIDDWMAVPYLKVNDQQAEINNCVQGNVGDDITISLQPKKEGDIVKFNVKAPDGNTLKPTNSKDCVIQDISMSDAGAYELQVRYTPQGGSQTVQIVYVYLDVQEHQGEYYDWEQHTPYWSYNFRDENPDGFPMPTKSHNFTKKGGGKANCVEGEWWSVFWGDNLNSVVGNNDYNAMTNMMKKYDTDFAYIRDVMGWPPDINARMGWKSFVYIFGSGLSNDNESQTTEGGYQSSTYVDGRSWPCVWASYYPVSRFRDDADRKWNDGDYQREAMIHEGIHATFADMEGVKQSAWFHEGGNVWLQMAMNAKRDNVYGEPGWLGVGNLICPFMPIECYSGWLQDGSFGGPSAEGVNMYNSQGRQVCTWRNLIGGVQYGEVFPLFLGEAVGDGAVPWIWRYCKTRVLEGIALGNKAENIEGIGDEAMRLLVMQYRARLATMDFGRFTKGCRNLLDSRFGSTVKAEWEPYWIDVEPFQLTPYQTLEPNDEEGWMAPDTITNPGWSGGNIIPIHVAETGCEVFFRPEDDNMMAQLCYRTKNGDTYYSQPVTCGKMKLSWTDSNSPANGVVFAVVANTDYIYTGEEQRKKHWDYRLKLGEGALAPASKDVRWYFYERTLTDPEFATGIEQVQTDMEGNGPKEPVIRILSGALRSGGQIVLDLNGIEPKNVVAHLVGVSGVLIDEQQVSDASTIQLPSNLRKGMYILALRHNGKTDSFKVYVE